MSGRFSKSEIDRLGERIRDAGELSVEDLELFQHYRLERRLHLNSLLHDLRTAGWRVTGRVKTRNTLIEKVLRHPTLALSKVQDVVGCRIVVEGGREDQDAVVARLRDMAPGVRVVDRRAVPSAGYRAVHVIVTYQEWPVEIQVRTVLQHEWAQAFEQLADVFGRGLRYGDGPAVPAGSGLTRAVIGLLVRRDVALMMRLSSVIDRVERTRSGPAAISRTRRRLARRRRSFSKLSAMTERQR